MSGPRQGLDWFREYLSSVLLSGSLLGIVHVEHNAVGLSWFLSTTGQNLPGPYALQSEPGLHLVAGQVIHSLLGAYRSVAPH